MDKIYKISFLLLILIFLFINTCNADTTNLYDVLENETSNSTSSLDDADMIDETLSSQASNSIVSTSATIAPISSVAQANLKLNNVLCIILIAIGILLILLAIAILIRLQK